MQTSNPLILLHPVHAEVLGFMNIALFLKRFLIDTKNRLSYTSAIKSNALSVISVNRAYAIRVHH